MNTLGDLWTDAALTTYHSISDVSGWTAEQIRLAENNASATIEEALRNVPSAKDITGFVGDLATAVTKPARDLTEGVTREVTGSMKTIAIVGIAGVLIYLFFIRGK